MSVARWRGDFAAPNRRSLRTSDAAEPFRRRFDRWAREYESAFIRLGVAAAGMTAAFVALLLTSDPFWQAVLTLWKKGPLTLAFELFVIACVGAFFIEPITEFIWSLLGGDESLAGESQVRVERHELSATGRRFITSVIFFPFFFVFGELFVNCCREAVSQFQDIRNWLLLVGAIPLAGFTAWYCCAAAQLGNSRYWSSATEAITRIYAIFAIPLLFTPVANFVNGFLGPPPLSSNTVYGALFIICVITLFVSIVVGFLLGGAPVLAIAWIYDAPVRKGRVIWFFVIYVAFGFMLALTLEGVKFFFSVLQGVSGQTVYFIFLIFLFWSIGMVVSPFRRYLKPVVESPPKGRASTAATSEIR
jgi:hypothetical protein